MVFIYNKRLPNVDEIVISKIDNINELGIDVSLVEYDNLKGYISYSEVSRKKKFNVNKILTVGKEVHLIVINVDKDKGFIDLSKRTINDEEITLFDEKYKIYIKLYNMFRHFFKRYYDYRSEYDNKELEDFLRNTLWKYQQSKEDKEIYELITNSDNNILLINDNSEKVENNSLDLVKLKNVIDDYIKVNIFVIKPSKEIIFTLYSVGEEGYFDLKYVLDYKNFYFFASVFEDYSISILYETNSDYKIIIKQNDYVIKNQDYDIDKVEVDILDEILKRSTERNMVFSNTK
jgi:translation initiation factor 2 alpha subunit (eIF-2alpha)